jgi:hypothetical protein
MSTKDERDLIVDLCLTLTVVGSLIFLAHRRARMVKEKNERHIVLVLPDDLLDNVLSSWLMLHDLAKLDTAFCNSQSRPGIVKRLASPSTLHCFAAEQRALQDCNRYSEMLRWVHKRHLRLSGLLIGGDMCNEEGWLTLQPLLGDRIAWLSFESASYVTFLKTILQCSNLRWLYLDCDIARFYREGTAYNARLLGRMEELDCRCDIQNTAFLKLCRACLKLEHLEMTRRCGVTERWFVRGLEQLPGLIYLHYSPSVHLQDATLSAIGRSCPRLRTFITGTRTLTRAQVLHYARCFPRLTSFGLPPQDFVLDFVLCPDIRELTVTAGMTGEYVRALLVAHKQLTHLRIRTDQVHQLHGVTLPQVWNLAIVVNDSAQLSALNDALLLVPAVFSNLRALQFVVHKYESADGVPRRPTYAYHLPLMSLPPQPRQDTQLYALALLARRVPGWSVSVNEWSWSSVT